MLSLYPLFVSVRDQINPCAQGTFSNRPAHLRSAFDKFSRFCFSRSRFPESQSRQMPTGKTVIRLCGSSFVEFRSQMPYGFPNGTHLSTTAYSGMRPLIMITSFLMSRVCQIWVIFCVDSKAVFWE